MSGILGLMDIAKRALAAQQLAVEVTSHNISNVNTVGFSRQRVNFETSTALPSPFGPLGYGVNVTGIERAFDPFVAARLDQNTCSMAYYKSLTADLNQVAGIFNETQDGGVNELLSKFWDAWHDLADNPSGAGERQSLLNQAENLADAISFRANQLVTFRTSITQRLAPTIDEINSAAARIARLNQEIKAIETPEHQANDLRDERQMQLNKLSGLIGIHYYNTGDGAINVSLANGTSLVEGGNAWSLRYEITPTDTVSVIWQGPGGTELDVTAGLTGGQLSAQIDLRDTLIPQYQTSLDELAQELIAGVNAQHSQGVGLEMFSTTTSSYLLTTADLAQPLANNPSLTFGDRITNGQFTIHVEDGSGASVATAITIDGTTTLQDLVNQLNAAGNITASIVTSGNENRLQITADAGYSFGFSEDDSNVLMALGVNTFFKGDNAYGIGVNDAVAQNANLIAAGRIDPTTGAHPIGDNRNALALADLGEDPVGPGGLTYADAYRQLVSGIGLDTEQAGNNQNYYQGLVDQFTQLRDSVSGVSLDEELTNLIKFQRAYQAAAKMVTTADELLQTLLSLKT